MFRFLFTKYRTLLVVELLLLVLVEVGAVLVSDVIGRWTASGDALMTIFTLAWFMLFPFALAFHATRRYRDLIPGPQDRAGLYIGGTANLLGGLVLVPFGFLQAWLGQSVLDNPQATTDIYLLSMPVGLVLFLCLGAIMGWVGQAAGRVVTCVVALVPTRAKRPQGTSSRAVGPSGVT